MAFKKMSTRAAGYVVLAADWSIGVDNFTFLNSAFHVPLFPRSSGIAPASGLQAAGLLTKQSSDAGAIKPEWPILTFDKDTDEGRIWNDALPRLYGITPTVVGQFYMPAVTSGTFLPAAQIACWSDTDATVEAKAFGAVNLPSAVTVPGTALTIGVFSITMTNFDSGVAIDSFSLAFWRDVSGDSAAEDVYLKRLDLFFNLTETTV